MLAIMSSKRLQRPTHPAFIDELWTLMQHCWDQDPRLRPDVSEVINPFPSQGDFLIFLPHSASHPSELEYHAATLPLEGQDECGAR